MYKSDLNIGLLSGDSGIVMSDIIRNKCCSKDSQEKLCKIIKKIENSDVHFSFCDGLAGVSWFFNYLQINKIIDIDVNLMFNESDKYLYCWMIKKISQGNFDYLHGAIGVGIYFLTRNGDSYRKYLNDLVDGLDKIAINRGDKTIIFNATLDYKTKQNGVNISLSHGMSSIIYFLSKTIEKDINAIKAKHLLIGIIDYLFANKLPKTQNYISIFPNFVIEGQTPTSSRLAWCYGDLGIGVSLYQAAKVLKIVGLEDFALNILYSCANRFDLKSNGVVDAGLCHGTSGIGHIFHRMFRYTNNEIFKNSAQYWFDETTKMAQFPDGINGYKVWKGEHGWINENNLLEGVAGIKLAQYCWENNINPDWDSCLLLS